MGNKKRIVTFFLIMAMSACGRGKKVESPSMGESIAVQKIAAPLAKMLIDSLGARLKGVLVSEGPVAAIAVCKNEAIEIGSRIDAPLSVELKRTSLKFRNPANAPDEYEQRALVHYQALTSAGEALPPVFIQKIITDEQPCFYFYKPLRVKSLCLICHGDPAKFAPDLRQALAKNYPGDRATGYAEGDFRGLVRVKIIDLK